MTNNTGGATTAPAPEEPDLGHTSIEGTSRVGDLVFRGAATLSSGLIVLVVLIIGVFLLSNAWQPLMDNAANFFTSTEFNASATPPRFGVAALLWTTVLSSLFALVIAVPVAMGLALLLTQFVRGRVATYVAFIIDLLAAVPSVIFGLWGIKVFGPAVKPVAQWLENTLGWIPLFGPTQVASPGTIFTASLVLAIMILPIITAITRDVLAQTPRDHIEAALALGATRWEVIRLAVLPYGRSGAIAAAMLGLGRALGETIAVMLILSKVAEFKVSVFNGGETFASIIARNAPEFDTPYKAGVYISAGLVLFLLTFAVNAIARVIADRGKARMS
ncbi:phosphate ABC transporter permease subunit PstC [Arachnia propionica]|uniref:Phosphate transport system permease protein n=1 Tax=Arachnia propionica TaxID=1750 RepID=A0A3P1WPW1_9ACTN|nr:phosphate ABC transporter permease subunit PstC [Arachnia propionica]